MKRQVLNEKLINLSVNISELFHENSDPKYNSLVGEYRKIEKHGDHPIKLSDIYIHEFENKHKIKIPEAIGDILLKHGEHPLCHFFLESQTKSKLLEPTYIIKTELFKSFISNGVNIYDIQEFKSDYNDYYNSKYDTFNLEIMDRVYQETKKLNVQSFDVILNTCQEVQVLLNGKNRGKLVSTNTGDRLININDQDYHQPYYSLTNKKNIETIDDIHLEHINKVIERLENKVINTITNIR